MNQYNPKKYTLTKSSYVKGIQCDKYLFLDKHKPEKKSPINKEKQFLFNQGKLFEEQVRKDFFKSGINIKETHSHFNDYPEITHQFLNNQSVNVLFEATFIHQKVLIMVDAIVKDEQGLFEIYEIKNTPIINKVIIADLQIQYFVCHHILGEKIKSFNLITPSKDIPEKFNVTNLIEELKPELGSVEQKIQYYNQILNSTEPKIKMGIHCNDPYECEFISHCKKRKFLFF